MSDLDDLLNKPIDTGGIPVLEFKGRLKAVNLVTGENNRQTLNWDFTEAEIIETRDPYPFPTVQLRIAYNNRDNTYYAAWKKSLDKVVQGPVSTSDLVGKVFHCKRLPAMVNLPVEDADGNPVMQENRPDRQKWENQSREVWQVVGIEGYASPQGNEEKNTLLVSLADGKTEQEFYSAIMQDDKLKQDSEIINAVISRALIPTMVSVGLIKNEGGKLSKV